MPTKPSGVYSAGRGRLVLQAAQGYLLSRPVPAEELTIMLHNYHASERGPAASAMNYA